MSWITSTLPTRPDALYFKVLKPAPALRRWVRYYWVLKDNSRAAQIDEYLAPDGLEEIIFSYADGFRREVICGADSRKHVTRGSYVVGTKSYGVACARMGQLAMVGIKLWPQMLHAIVRMPLHDLSGMPLSLEAINSPVLNEIEGRVFDASSEEAIKRALDDALMQAMTDDLHDLVGFSTRLLFEAQGILAIDELIERCGVHYRTLEKAFRERVGLPPKALAKILRFKHAFNSLSQKADAGRLGALECGYYDQSHFCKEFKFFTGRAPSRFFRDRLSIDVARFCLALDLHTLNDSSPASEFVL